MFRFLTTTAFLASLLMLQGPLFLRSAASTIKIPAELQAKIRTSMKAYAAGEFQNARGLFHAIAVEAEKKKIYRTAAMNWNNAGACSLAVMQYLPALQDFMQAKNIAENARLTEPLANTLNNLAALYLHIGQPANALQVSLAGLRVSADYPEARAKLRFQSANSLSQLDRFDEADPVYRLSIQELIDQNNLTTAARELGLFGNELVRANRLPEAESALSEALRLTRIHRLDGAGNILRGLANLRSIQGDAKSAALLFDAAIDSPPGLTPRWGIYMDRGHFRLKSGLLQDAFDDFREARRIALEARADMVPADQDGVALRDGLSGLMEGLVDSGNRLARSVGNPQLLSQTFDAAEQDRLWSLRTLAPGAEDWRTRLPGRYWELLANYQAVERTAIGARLLAQDPRATALALEMRQIELVAGAGDRSLPSDNPPALVHVRNMLGEDSVLLSFHVTATSSWLWAVDRHRTAVYQLPALSVLQGQVKGFSAALQSGVSATGPGTELYNELFGHVAAAYLAHKHWLLEPDGPLYELPFAALVTGRNQAGDPEYLVERSALQLIPGAFLMQHGALRTDRGFLGIGDAIYNGADPRFNASRPPELALPRLPNTANELAACARQFPGGHTRLLTGSAATLSGVEAAIRANPSVIHFATHVVSSNVQPHSGLIALSLDAEGAMGLLSTKEISMRPVTASLIVMDGCHSGQGKAVPSAGLMGLTRAWIAAGARAVLATQWDLPDTAGPSLVTAFYRALNRTAGISAAAALREAQIEEINGPNGRYSPATWAGYFLLSRI